MNGYRSDIDAAVGPATEGLTGGRSRLLVRVRMFDDGVEHPQPDVLCDLRPDHARELGFYLLVCAEHAEQLSPHQQPPHTTPHDQPPA